MLCKFWAATSHFFLTCEMKVLMELARGREYEVYDRSLDVQISRLRKLIEPDPSNPLYIQTVWGLGYVFIPEGQPR